MGKRRVWSGGVVCRRLATVGALSLATIALVGSIRSICVEGDRAAWFERFTVDADGMSSSWERASILAANQRLQLGYVFRVRAVVERGWNGGVTWKAARWERVSGTPAGMSWWIVPRREVSHQPGVADYVSYEGAAAGLGVQAVRCLQGTDVSYVHISVPLWLLMVPGGLVVWRWWRRRRQPAEGCKSCGYDLRATPGRYPECGAIAATS